MSISTPNIKDILVAEERIATYIHKTPVLTSRLLNHLTQANLFFKCENFQKIGAFKFRGACNAVFSLSDAEAENGVATHSSGNHGAALALAAKTRGIKAYIVMPDNSPEVKKQAVASYGAHITYCAPTMAARIAALNEILAKTKATFIHPYDDKQIICGQGTIALELFKQCHGLDALIIPVGGGGLIAGNAIVSNTLHPEVAVFGAEPLGANDGYLSFKAKKIVETDPPETICDGLWTPIGQITFPIILKHVNNIFAVKDESVLLAMKLIWERMKIIVEPSAAISLACVLENPEVFHNKNVGLLLTGGNVDIAFAAKLMG